MALGEGQVSPQRRKGPSLSRSPEDRLCLLSWLWLLSLLSSYRRGEG